jgi:zinc transport system permease protein
MLAMHLMLRFFLSLSIVLLSWNGIRADDLRGTLTEHGQPGQLMLRTESGETRVLAVRGEVECRTGLNGQGREDLSLQSKGTPLRVIVASDGQTVQEIYVLYPWYAVPAQWLDERLDDLKEMFPGYSLLGRKQMLLGFVSVILVSVICGAVSSLVLSNRMAFFSDALAHFAFAGVALGILMNLAGLVASDEYIVPVMVLFGVLTGCGIAYVKQKTVLANDTIIGVFFAGAMGLGAVLLTAVTKIGGGRGSQNPETFLFGDPMAVTSQHLVYLLILLLVTLIFLAWRYNGIVMASFNPSLARSRRISVELGNYLFIIFLAMTVNACLKVVGALLINALLILPAATAGNVSRTLRQFFWVSLVVSLGAGLGGFLLSATWQPRIGEVSLPLASGGVIVLAGTACFFVSILMGPWLRGRRPLN